VTSTPTITHRVGAKAWEGASALRGPVLDPARGAQAAEVVLADVGDVDEAVARARQAFQEWSRVPPARRAKVLFAARDLIDRHTDDLARLISAEHGKVLADARGEVGRGLEVVEVACGIPTLLTGRHSPQTSSAVDTWTVREPLGVVVGITPFNFPVMVPLWMAPVALACGDAVILKPSEKDPSAPNLLAELFAAAGLPDGVLTVLHGDRTAVDALLQHPGVDAISFVGSTAVARHVYATAAAAGKRVQALGGAKNHQVVMPDADVAAAADGAVSAAYGSAGERCMAISVVAAVGPVADELVAAIAERAEGLSVADPFTDGADMGPLVTGEHRDRVAGLVDGGVGEGATLVVDGRAAAVADRPDGFFLGPCLFDHVTPEMAIYQEEIFGPVLCVVRVPDLDAALQLIADNPYGNGAAIFTRDGGAARRFEGEVDAGMVGVNVPIPVPVAHHSFGGRGDSLFGDTHVHGPEGVHFYTQAKVVTSRWDPRPADAPDLHFKAATQEER
jgi:malonate-semialdehyde dehydrogenase (acetylating)/methylmalonate-semialdehyde dehydrogenase